METIAVSMAPTGTSVWSANVIRCEWPDEDHERETDTWLCGGCHWTTVGVFSSLAFAKHAMAQDLAGPDIDWLPSRRDRYVDGVGPDGHRYILELETIDEEVSSPPVLAPSGTLDSAT